jgi:hypothetical protein
MQHISRGSSSPLGSRGAARRPCGGTGGARAAGEVLAAVVVAQLKAGSDALGEGAQADADTLPIGSRASKRVARRAAWMPMHAMSIGIGS